MYKKSEEKMPLFSAKIEDNTIGSCHRYRLLSPSISFYLLLSSIILSCTGGTVFHSYKPLSAEGWDRCDTICFDIPKSVRDIHDGTLAIGLRTVAYVGIQDIVLAVEQRNGTGLISRCDTVRYPLNDTEGNALTKGVNHHQYEDRQLPFQQKEGQIVTICIHHLMTHETMHGITELGIKINTPL